MKKFYILAILLLNLISSNCFSAQAKSGTKSEQQKISQLEQLLEGLRINTVDKKNKATKWKKIRIAEQIKKIKEIFESGLNPNTIINFTLFSEQKNSMLQIISELLGFPDFNENKEELLNLASWLVNNGADINQRNSEGLTPLHRAVYDGAIVFAKFLIEHGADLNSIDGNNNSILNSATFSVPYAGSKLQRDFIELLLINGAKFVDDKKFNENKVEKHFQNNVKMFDEVLKEIIDKYKKELSKKIAESSGIGADESQIIYQYAYDNDYIINNILEIRRMLGEFENQASQQRQQQQGGGGGAAAR